jgi:hypothetical protein
VRLEGLSELKKFNNFIGNLTRYLPAFSVAPQPLRYLPAFSVAPQPLRYLPAFSVAPQPLRYRPEKQTTKYFK